jgi:hypothetical protein
VSKKKAQKPSGATASPKQPSLASHPRAQRSIQLAKDYAGLGACALAGFAAWHGGAPFLDVATRALIWGVAAYLLVWALSVQVWRHLAVAEVRAAERRWREQREAEEERVRKLRQAIEDSGKVVG